MLTFRENLVTPIGMVLLKFTLGIVIFHVGILAFHRLRPFRSEDGEFAVEAYYNSYTVAGIINAAITVAAINWLQAKRFTQGRKQEYTLQLSSPDQSTAIEALQILRHLGWLTDGSLKCSDLKGSNLSGMNLISANLIDAQLGYSNLQNAAMLRVNLEGANLKGACLRGADLWRADLRGANLLNAILQDTSLREATMPNSNEWSLDTDLKLFTEHEGDPN